MSAGPALDVAVEPPWPIDAGGRDGGDRDAGDIGDGDIGDGGLIEGIAVRAAQASGHIAAEIAHPRLEASIVFTSDAQVRLLNAEWRGRDKPTNVLSFPMLTRAELLALVPDGPPVLLGDIALAYETCAREAAEKGIALADHAAHLIVHGLLHLAGHDHETSPADADAMEALETKALALMGIADPYGDED